MLDCGLMYEIKVIGTQSRERLDICRTEWRTVKQKWFSKVRATFRFIFGLQRIRVFDPHEFKHKFDILSLKY